MKILIISYLKILVLTSDDHPVVSIPFVLQYNANLSRLIR